MKLGCTRCGASVVFVPSTGKCHCNHCGEDIDPDEYTNLNEKITYQECKCSSCGAKLVVEESTKITVCAYCGSKYFHLSDYKGDIKVDGIIPFEIDREEFQRRADDFLISQKLSTQEFRYSVPISEVKGIYLLAKEFKTNSTVYARGTNKDSCHFFEFRYDVRNSYLKDNSSSFNDIVFNRIGPYPTDNIQKFSPFYLADFSVDQGNENENNIVSKIVKKEGKLIYKEIDQVLYDQNGITQKEGIRTSHTFIEEKNNILVPVWLFTIKYEGYNFTYAMNGKTGKIYGKLPEGYDKRKDETEVTTKISMMLMIMFLSFAILVLIAPFIAQVAFVMVIALTITAMIYNPLKDIILKRKKGAVTPISKLKLYILILLYLLLLYLLKLYFNLSLELFIILIFASPGLFVAIASFIPEARHGIYTYKSNRIIHYVDFNDKITTTDYKNRFNPYELASVKNIINANEKEFVELVKNNGVGIEIVSKDS